MTRLSKMSKKKLSVLAGCLISLIFILIIFTPLNVDPLNTVWVRNGGGDNLQHYLGWRFFRNDGWTRYFLFMRNLNYPVGTSVIVTDSNPLFCLLLKPLNNFLPEEFQFNGIWIVFSFLLIAFFSGLISWQLTGKISFTLAGTIISILNPVVLQRALIHDTLTAHWLILAAVWLAYNFKKQWNPAGWFVLTEAALLIHIYFIPMIAFVLMLQMIRMARKHQPVVKTIMPAVIFVLALFAGYYFFGYSHILPQTGSYGELSMNLNAFINPDSIPSMLGSRETNPLQYEGFNYWGIGLILIVLAACILEGKNFIKNIVFYIVPSLLLVLMAVSNQAYFDKMQVWNFEIPEWINSYLSIFRSSGRLVWPLYYLVLFVSLYVLAKKSENSKYVIYIVLFCVMIQAADLNEFHRQTTQRFQNPGNNLPELDTLLRESIPDEAIHLYCSEGDPKVVDALALFAADHHLTFNKSANARSIERIFGGDQLEMSGLSCSQLQPGSVYIYLDKGDYPSNIDLCENAEISKNDGWIVVNKKPSS